MKRNCKEDAFTLDTPMYIVTEKENIEVKVKFFFLPKIGEELQYNGVAYRIYNIRHHYHESFRGYIEFFCMEIK